MKRFSLRKITAADAEAEPEAARLFPADEPARPVEEAPVCPVHGRKMRVSKFYTPTGYYCPVKVNGQWCAEWGDWV